MLQVIGVAGQHGEHNGYNGSGTPQLNNGVFALKSFYQYCWQVWYGENSGWERRSGATVITWQWWR